MPFIAWSDRLSVGVEPVDADHKQLIAMINELYDGIVAGRSKEIVGGILDRLVEYTEFHFAREEEFFARTGYPDAAIHTREHNELRVWALKAQAQFRDGALAAPSLEVMNYLKDWLFDHILGSDMSFGPHLNAKGVD
jgi:hemerythrin